MTITYATYLAVMALAAAHGELNQGITRLDPLERADMIYADSEFQAQAFSEFTEAADDHGLAAICDLDGEFAAFYNTMDEGDRAFLEAAIIA